MDQTESYHHLAPKTGKVFGIVFDLMYRVYHDIERYH